MIKSVVIEKTNNLTKVSVSDIIDVANNRFFVDKIYGNYIKTLKNYKLFDGNKKGVTPLMEAVSTGKKEVVVVLVSEKADAVKREIDDRISSTLKEDHETVLAESAGMPPLRAESYQGSPQLQ